MKLTNPVATATRGKGFWNMVKRSTAIGRRYGLTARKMERIMTRFDALLARFNARATFPITGAALARSRNFVEKYRGERIEFAAHGYFHVDHAQLSLAEQVQQFSSASRLFDDRGLVPAGFRCPYLRWSGDTITAIRQAGFLYDSSQALAWDVADADSPAYRRVLQFYGATSAARYPALPRWDGALMRNPYCLPDDEALIDRLIFATDAQRHAVWPALLAETHRLGELFTLGLHPERLAQCEAGLVQTLQLARTLSPAVWCARLDEIAAWWRARTHTAVTINDGDSNDGALRVRLRGPEGVTALVRHLDVAAETEAWYGAYRRVRGLDFGLRAEKRPFIALSPRTAPPLSHFLRQQGYIVETAVSGAAHTCFLDRPTFTDVDERPLLDAIEQDSFPLLRLGRWPHGARSALFVTGDIDALTIWDYGLRFLGN